MSAVLLFGAEILNYIYENSTCGDEKEPSLGKATAVISLNHRCV